MNCTAEVLTVGELTTLNIMFVLLKCYELARYMATLDWLHIIFALLAIFGLLRIIGWIFPPKHDTSHSARTHRH